MNVNNAKICTARKYLHSQYSRRHCSAIVAAVILCRGFPHYWRIMQYIHRSIPLFSPSTVMQGIIICYILKYEFAVLRLSMHKE